jgi:phosphatidylglycerol lysyltransferase
MPEADKAQLIGTLLVFRAVYYLLPLTIAAALFGGHELLSRQEGFRAYLRLPHSRDS